MRHDDIEGLRVTGRIGYWERDVETGAMHWNPAIDDILGLAPARPSFDAMLDPVVPEDRERLRAALESSLERRSTQEQIVYRCRLPDGREVVVRNEWSREADESGRDVLRGVLQDVTQRQKTKEELRRYAELLGLLYDVAACANEAETVAQVLDVSLERVCTFGGWSVGHVLLVSDDGRWIKDVSRVLKAACDISHQGTANPHLNGRHTDLVLVEVPPKGKVRSLSTLRAQAKDAKVPVIDLPPNLGADQLARTLVKLTG